MVYHKQLINILKNIGKFQESFFKIFGFGFVYFYGLLIIFNPFNKESSNFFWNPSIQCSHTDNDPLWPQSNGDIKNSFINLNYYYWIQIGYHGHRAMYQFLEHSRKDFIAMFIHHWVTVLLLIGSYAAGYQQIGSMVLLSNDNLDLIMPFAKITQYLEYKNLSNLFFGLFAALWIPFRVVLYFNKVLMLPFGCGYYIHLRPYIAHWILVFGLCIIYALQIYWTKFLLQMLYRKFIKGETATDTRSDDESSSNSNDKENKKRK